MLQLFRHHAKCVDNNEGIVDARYLEALIRHYFDPGQAKHSIKIITPSTHRGCQLSLKFSCSVKEVLMTSCAEVLAVDIGCASC